MLNWVKQEGECPRCVQPMIMQKYPLNPPVMAIATDIGRSSAQRQAWHHEAKNGQKIL